MSEEPIIPNAYSCEFEGFWPVGAVAVVTAASKEEAVVKLEKALKKHNLPQKISIEQLKELHEGVTILLDGDY